MTSHQDSLKTADNRTCPRFKSCHPESRHKNSPPAYAPGLFFRLRITGLEHIQNRKTILVAIIFSLRFGCQVPFTNISYHFRKRRKSDRIKTNPLSHRFRSEDESFYQFDKFKLVIYKRGFNSLRFSYMMKWTGLTEFQVGTPRP